MTAATFIQYTQSGNVKRYEAQYGPRVWDYDLPLDFKRTNTGNTSYEYSLSVEGYECIGIDDSNLDDDGFIEVGYGDDDNGLEVIKTFYFKRTQININIYLVLVALKVMNYKNVINKSTSSIVIDVDIYENGKDTKRSYGTQWKVTESDYYQTNFGNVAVKTTISGIKYVEGMYVKISLNSATIINSEAESINISDTYTYPRKLHIVLPGSGADENNVYGVPGDKYGLPRRYWYKCYSGEEVNAILWLNKNRFEFDSVQNIQYTTDPFCWLQTLVNVKNYSNLNLTLNSIDNDDDMARIVLSNNRYNTDGDYSGVSVYGSMLKARGVVFNFQEAGVVTNTGTGYDLNDGTGVRFGDVKSLNNDDNNTPLFLTLTEYDVYGYETLTSHLNTYVEMKSGVGGDLHGMYLCSSNPYIEALYPTNVHAFLLINEEIIDDMLPNVDYIDDMISDNSKLIFANLIRRTGTDQRGFPTMSSYYYHATFNVKDLIDRKAKYADITRTTYFI